MCYRQETQVITCSLTSCKRNSSWILTKSFPHQMWSIVGKVTQRSCKVNVFELRAQQDKTMTCWPSSSCHQQEVEPAETRRFPPQVSVQLKVHSASTKSNSDLCQPQCGFSIHSISLPLEKEDKIHT